MDTPVQASVREATPVRSEYRALLQLAWPLALTQLGVMFMGVVDTLAVARLHVDALAASALANMWNWGFLSIGFGIVMGIDAQVSQAHGRGDGEASARALQRGVILAVLVSIPITIAKALTYDGLIALGQTENVATLAQQYNLIQIPATPAFLLYAALKQYLQGRAMVGPATYVMWAANVVNALLTWVLVFGHLGAPAMGLPGAALASTIAIMLMPLGLLVLIKLGRLHEGAWRPWDRHSFAKRELVATLVLGFPIGMQMALEAWAFTLASFMAGWIDVTNLAAHQIVLNMAALAFMVPLGVSMAAATRVGNLIGEGDVVAMRRAVKASLVLGACAMGFSAILFSTLRMQLPMLYTDDLKLVALAASILPIAAAFQLADGVQVVAGGVLRGMGRPNAAALINLLGYYAFALPLAYTLAFTLELGLVGIWLALAAGLLVVAISLSSWALKTARRPIEDLRLADGGSGPGGSAIPLAPKPQSVSTG